MHPPESGNVPQTPSTPAPPHVKRGSSHFIPQSSGVSLQTAPMTPQYWPPEGRQLEQGASMGPAASRVSMPIPVVPPTPGPPPPVDSPAPLSAFPAPPPPRVVPLAGGVVLQLETSTQTTIAHSLEA
jgi:hypothetical protein